MQMMQSRRIISGVVALAIVLAGMVAFVPGLSRVGAVSAQTTCDYPTEAIQIMAPASPGGGWDTTAREIQAALQDGIVDESVEVFNVEGAGGTIGLAQLTNDNGGDPHTLMVMGMVMIGAIATNQSPATLESVTPLARLTGEFEVIVVPKDSEYQTLDQLIEDFKADPGSISWAGGSAGGTDHILVGLIANAVGVDPTAINYVPYSGGGEALAAILGGQVSAGVSGFGEWQDQIATGELRALAISGSSVDDEATPTANTGAAPEIQTLQEQGIDVELANWRGIVAPPDVTPEQRDCIIEVLQQMHDSQAWQDALAKYGWQDLFLADDEFDQFLMTEQERILETLRTLGLVS